MRDADEDNKLRRTLGRAGVPFRDGIVVDVWVYNEGGVGGGIGFRVRVRALPAIPFGSVVLVVVQVAW